jgi:hypothetical protein
MNPESRPKNSGEEIKKPTPEQGIEKKSFTERVSLKANAVEEANLAFKNGDTSSLKPEEIENLKNKMPGFIRLISGRIENIKSETNESNKDENDIKIKELERLLKACQENQTYFQSNNKETLNSETSTKKPEAIESIKPEPENEQYQQLDMFKEAGVEVEGTVASESKEETKKDTENAEDGTSEDDKENTKKDAEGTKGSAQRERPVTDRGPSQQDAREIAEEASLERERYKNLDEITYKLIENNYKLRGLLASLESNTDESKIVDLENQIENTITEIEDLSKQLEEQPDDLNPEDSAESERLMAEIEKLENEVNADPNSPESQNSLNRLNELSREYQNIQDKISQDFNERNTAVNMSFNSIDRPLRIQNSVLKNKVEEVLIKSQSDYREKFSRIEKNINSGNIK